MINPEVLTHLPEITEFIGFLTIASFSVLQKRYVMDRDKKCQLPEKHDCVTSEHDQVHHIIPQRYAKEMGIPDVDFVENGIRLCLNAHVGEIRPGVPGLHPDMIECKKKYKTDKNAFKEMFEERKKKLSNKEPYWNTKWDRLLHVIAIKNTQIYKLMGYMPPERKKCQVNFVPKTVNS